MFESIKRDAGLRRDWESYCLIGDVLRDDSPSVGGFHQQGDGGLSDEVTVLAPVRRESGGWARQADADRGVGDGVAAVGWWR